MNKTPVLVRRLLALVLFAGLCATIAVEFGEHAAARQQAPRQDAGSASVWGTVRDAAGKPMEGALVSIRGVDQTFTTSVYTDENGEFVSPPLSPRHYRAWVQAAGFAMARAELAIDGRPVSQSFTLKTIDDITPQLTGAEWLDSLPDATPADRRMKQILRVVCADCHSVAVILQNRFDEQGWRMLARAMADTQHQGWSGRPGPFTQIVRYHADEIAAYLAKVRGPGPSPLKLAARPRPRGAAAQVVITDYDVPIAERPNELAWFDGSDWSRGPAVGTHGIVGPHDVMADHDGIAWIHEGRPSFETHRTFTRLNPSTGDVRAWAVIRDKNVLSSEQMEIDKFGNIWAHFGGNAVMRWTPSTETLTPFGTPPGFPRFVNSIDSDSTGRVWFNVYYGSARLDPTTKKWQVFQSSPPYDGFSYGMAVDAEDNGWWSAWNGDEVYKGDVKTGKVMAIPMRDPEYEARKALATKEDLEFYESHGSLAWGGLGADPIPYASAPRRLAADKHGTTVWVPNWAGSNIAEIDIHTNRVTYHKLPVTGNAYKTDLDNQHNVYASVPLADSLVKYDPATKSWTVYPFATHGCGPRHVSVDRQRGEVWVPCDQASKVQRFQFRTAAQIRSQKGAAQAGANR